jgi:predicted CopG family antitoxin
MVVMMSEKNSDSSTIKIPDDLYKKIEEKIEGTSFTSVEDYVVRKMENEFPAEPVYSKEEEELIKERLRRLGYIE